MWLEWPINLDGIDYRLTGIDLNADALQRRVEKVGDLDEAILGDLTVKGTIPPGRYDVVYSSFVLEHIHDAEAALALMLDGLKPGGLLLLRIPDRDAVYGWTTRHTPFSAHLATTATSWVTPTPGSPAIRRFAPTMRRSSPGTAYGRSATTTSARLSKSAGTPITSGAKAYGSGSFGHTQKRCGPCPLVFWPGGTITSPT